MLTFRHRQTSSYKRLSIISEKRFPTILSCKKCRVSHKKSPGKPGDQKMVFR
ncbi:hypothetical protein AH4AK4_0951 [Aeromonas hydrophila 4AK4]|nr:hypothetical protein AH4AK4_0951 [Aeromonas hydrophila 4AK4]